MIEVTQLLRQLVRIPSVNPMGRDMPHGDLYESRVSDFLCHLFDDAGIAYQRQAVATGRDNVVARLPGGADLPTILWDAHQDTVPVDGMTIDPFEAAVRDGRVYGRGACDVKGGLAAMITALLTLQAESKQDHPTILLACTCDEEFGQQGARHLIENQGVLPDMAIVAEPTELDVAVAHRGATRWKLVTHGRAAHSSDPCQGVNAIYAMSHVVVALERYAAELIQREPHPLCGPRTLSVGRIVGGESVNVVPPTCEIEIDHRVLPSEDGREVIESVREYLTQHLPGELEWEMLPPWSISHPLREDVTSRDLAERLLAAGSWGDGNQRGRADVAASSRIIGVPFGTHAARYARAGIPSVVFGPGSIRQAHTKDEWIEVNQLQRSVSTLVRCMLDWRR